jgi:hypothetical protein
MAKPFPAVTSMIVLNKRANTPSRFFLKGKGFASGAKVYIDGNRVHRSNRVGGQLISARVRYAELVALRAAGPPPTGELDVTITVRNGSEESDPILVTVYVDDDDDVTDDA